MTLERSQQNLEATVDELEARRVIKECDRELANYRAALKASPSDAVASWIRGTKDRRKAAELPLHKMTTGEGMTAAEIRELVERMQGIVAILQSASTAAQPRTTIRNVSLSTGQIALGVFLGLWLFASSAAVISFLLAVLMLEWTPNPSG